MIESQLRGQGKEEFETITAFAAQALGRWTGTLIGTFKIQSAVGNLKILGERKVLGGSRDLKRESYALSSILRSITQDCMRVHGCVFVVYGSAGMGKTSACHAVMGRYAHKGVAILPGEIGGNYKKIFLNRIGLNADKPPRGWLQKFFDELQTPVEEDPAVLMLDDFMNVDPDDLSDRAFLMNIKLAIRGKNVVVFTLTTNQRSANKMITWNGMVSIIPAGTQLFIEDCRCRFQRHKDSNPETHFSIDWNEGGRLNWTARELKNAVLANPHYAKKSEEEKNILADGIDEFIQQWNDMGRPYELNPEIILQKLAARGDPDILASPREGWSPTFNCFF
uniref:Uncharacterized protein n=1 Tax=Amphora coffeiformis TaxID=265554 RepID=A0A7S3L7E7_9STRA|mmetsp:Transcript_26741/g.50476  ORF Transcript_26741/g.50476 Transcript_26741/m.50476 type:complete len:336 (+) Transcript_26741:52-1059(+)|eukprot:scaffold6899_cov183-Amphora_coffeaeformis.AAC.34